MVKNVLLGFSLLLSLNQQSFAQTLDATFGTGGKVSTPVYGANESYRSVVVQADDKIIAAGFAKNQAGFKEFALVRYNGNGTIDNTFGTGGKCTIPVTNSNDEIKHIALQTDGKIIAVGITAPSLTTSSMQVVRLLANGTLDNTFGTGGKVTTQVGVRSGANKVAIQNDGKIVIAGNEIYDYYVLARYTTTGALDNMFGLNGTVKSNYNGAVGAEGIALAIQNDGKILVAGEQWGSGPLAGIARHNADGSPDNTFGTNGRLEIQNPYPAETNVWGGHDIKLQTDGKILLSIFLAKVSVAHQPAIVRLAANGTLDNTYGTNGYAVPAFGMFYEVGEQMCVQSDGKVIMGGHIQNSPNDSMLLVRFNTNGTPDNTFGNNGRLGINTSGTPERANGIAIQSDGKILLAGISGAAGTNKNMLLRFGNTTGGGGGGGSTTVANVVAKNGITIYPNPTTSLLNISTEVPFKANTMVQITNTMGQMVMQAMITGGQVNISTLAPGIYHVAIMHDQKAIHIQTIEKQ